MAAYLRPSEVAERWGMSPRQIRRLCAGGELRAMNTGSDWRIPTAAVQAYEARHTTTAEAAQQPAAASRQEVRPTTSVGGFTLPDDYEPVFKDLWPFHETKKAAPSRH